VFVGIARYDLRIPDARSLKDKRAVVKSLTASLRAKFNCAVAEVDHQDVWQRTAIGLSVISDSHFHARQMLAEIGRRIDTHPGAEIINATTDIVTPE
jgi:uncharacterized protein YlxP (DUF503 family)